MRKIPLFALSFVTWIILVWKIDYQNVLAGIFIALVSSLLFGGIGVEKEPARKTPFTPDRFAKFLSFVLFVAVLWVRGAMRQAVVSLFEGGEEGLSEEKKWIKTELKKDSSRFFLMHALFYAPDIIAIDFEDDKVLVGFPVKDDGAAGRAEETVRRLEKKIIRIFE